MTIEHAFDCVDVIPGIYHDGFPALLVTKYGAVASQESDRQNFVNHNCGGALLQ
jgi:hypothetical protein